MYWDLLLISNTGSIKDRAVLWLGKLWGGKGGYLE